MPSLKQLAVGVLLSAACIARGHDSDVGASVAPGDDFFTYANDAWLKQAEIPAGMKRWTARNEIDMRVQRQMEQLLADPAAAGSSAYERRVRDFRAAYLDRAAIDAKGLQPISLYLKQVDAINEKIPLSRALGETLRADVDPLNWGIYSSPNFFGLAIEQGIHGEKHWVAYLLQGGLGLLDRDRYLLSSVEAQGLRQKYQVYVEHALAKAGFNHAAARAVSILELETKIARCHASEEASSPDKNADNLWSRAELAARIPGIDWTAFFDGAQMAKLKTVVAWQPDAIKCEAALVASESLETWKDYLRFHVIQRYAEVLPKSIADEAFAIGDAIASNPRSRAIGERATDATLSQLTETVGRVYVERYFSADSKALVQTITRNVIAAFAKRLTTVNWLADDSKLEAGKKLQSLYFGVAYPESWSDESNLSITANDAVGNFERASAWRYRSALAKLEQSMNTRSWVLPPHRVAAVLNFNMNSYNFPAALLQAPKFDPNESDAYNYGAIGAIIGHEVSHFLDTLGADYDATGAQRHWWSDKDRSGYEAAADLLAKQFSGYQPIPGMTVNGKTTSVENVADLAGLTVAFEAHRKALGVKVGDPEFVRRQDREFFIGFARSWRSTSSDEALRTQLEKDNHAPDRYRIATVRNLDAWYKAFDVTPGQKLYLAPQDRVRVW